MYLYGNEEKMVGKLNPETYITLDFQASTLVINDLSGGSIGSGSWEWNDSENSKAPDLTGSYEIDGTDYRISAWYHEGADDNGGVESYYSSNVELARPPRGQVPRNPNR